jgi:large subunit ribosomal protein L23
MSLNPFKKNQPAGGKKTKPIKKDDVVVEEKQDSSPMLLVGQTGNAEAYRVLKNFYISEKASLLNGFNQYVFKVFRSANKSQIRKQVEKLFKVKIKSVKVLNMPRKRRDLGRHPGFKSEFKKAIVVLEKGQTIEQAKP